MVKYYASKIFQYVLVLWVVLTLNFALPRLMPGDQVKYILGEDATFISAEMRAEIEEEHGLNDPWIVQYGNYLKGIFTGDFGYSYQKDRPVMELIAERLPWTVSLALVNVVLTTIIGSILGVIAAWNRAKKTDVILSSVMMFLKSMPSFWVGMILIAIFGSTLGWLPTFGARNMWDDLTGFAWFIDVVRHMILPSLTMLVLSLSSTFITMRYSMIDTLGEDYIMLPRIKGLPEKKIRYRHAMRNALIPVATSVMMDLGYIVGGSTIIETVFAYPGTGRLMFEAVSARDFPLIQGCFLISTICVLVANIVADLIYPIIDPKVV